MIEIGQKIDVKHVLRQCSSEIIALMKDEHAKPEELDAKVKAIHEKQGFDALNQLMTVKDKSVDRRLVRQQSLDFR